MNLAVRPGEDSNEEGEVEEKEEEPDEPEPEVGPPLLTPLSQDAGQTLPFHSVSTDCPAAKIQITEVRRGKKVGTLIENLE